VSASARVAGVRYSLSTGTFLSGEFPVQPEVQGVLLDLLSGAGHGSSRLLLVEKLTRSNASGAHAPAVDLVEMLSGLLDTPENLVEAVLAYNAFLEASSASFILDPPVEFLVARALLARLLGLPSST
jgi:hypothetical protein